LACEPFRPNRRRALQVLLACSRGASNAELLLQIGRMYRSGYGNNSGRPDESDYMLAFRYTESAARENDVEPVLLMNIMSDLGVMYSEGRGTPSSFKRAAEAMKAACPRHLREFRENCKRVIRHQFSRHGQANGRRTPCRRSVRRAHHPPPPRAIDCSRSHLSSGCVSNCCLNECAVS
jgi:hypothetical protein